MGKITDELRDIINNVDAPHAQKTICRNVLHACDPLENGGANSIQALSQALLAQTGILIEMYLRSYMSPAEMGQMITQAIATQAQHCAASKQTLVSWPQLIVTATSKMTWPGAMAFAIYILREPLVTILLKLVS